MLGRVVLLSIITIGGTIGCANRFQAASGTAGENSNIVNSTSTANQLANVFADRGLFQVQSTTALPAAQRFVLTQNTYCYSDVVYGNDANSGLVSSAPKKSPQSCADLISNTWDLAGHSAIIQNAPNQTDTLGVIFSPNVGGGAIILDMAGSTILTEGNLFNFTTNGNFHAMGPIGTTAGGFPATIIIQNAVLKMAANSTFGCSITNNGAGAIVIGQGVHFGFAASAHMCGALSGAYIGFVAPYFIDGSSVFHYFADNASTIGSSDSATPINIKIASGVKFTGGFAGAYQNGNLLMPQITFSGAIPAGPRYYAGLNGTIFTGTYGNQSYFPGTSAGYLTTGGQYQ